MLADLDESLRELLKRDLGRHGFDGVEIVFDAPTKEWAASLSSPTVNLFLYDIREPTDKRLHEWQAQKSNGETRETRPPLRVEASYAVTAWTRAVEDEHRLLSQVLAILYAYTVLPGDVLAGALTNGVAALPLETRIVQERSDDKADFWTSIGGQYKASLDYVVLRLVRVGHGARARARGADSDRAAAGPRQEPRDDRGVPRARRTRARPGRTAGAECLGRPSPSSASGPRAARPAASASTASRLASTTAWPARPTGGEASGHARGAGPRRRPHVAAPKRREASKPMRAVRAARMVARRSLEPGGRGGGEWAP